MFKLEKSALYTGLFVLLWGSAAIFSRVALNHGHAFTVLVFRFGIAVVVLLLIQLWRRQPLWPQVHWRQALSAGLLLVAGYCSFYFLALETGMTPGILATLLGVQPIVTLLLLERRAEPRKLIGLLLAFAGLILLVWQGLINAQVSVIGLLYALAALACITSGSILQKRQRQDLVAILLAQYGVSLLVFVAIMATKGMVFTPSLAFVVTTAWLGVVVSVLAQLLLYYLISAKNLVNTTSLFYLVPCVTVGMDYVFLGNTLALSGLAGIVAVLLGIFMVFLSPNK
ncbi:MAG: DMT family transporter [Neisseriaceae bacterium]|nr:DMT family transporter [Neisseriaceae bacterium]